MVRAITFDAFGTLIDTGRDVLIRIARSVCEDQRPSLDGEALLATWDRHFFAAETAPFLTLAEITEDSLAKTFREYTIDASPAPYVDRLVALWREAKAYAEVHADRVGEPRRTPSRADRPGAGRRSARSPRAAVDRGATVPGPFIRAPSAAGRKSEKRVNPPTRLSNDPSLSASEGRRDCPV